jgi:SIS domain-containing protein
VGRSAARGPGRQCGGWGFDGLELACWGDHFDVAEALRDPAYCAAQRAVLDRHGLRVCPIAQPICHDVEPPLESEADRHSEQLELSLREPVELEPCGGTVVARGINYCTAFEVALKIRELFGLHFEAYSAADLMHGPVAALSPGWPVLAIAPAGPPLESMNLAISSLVDRGARVTVVGENGALRLVTGVPEWLSPLVAVVPGQVIAVRLAQHLERNTTSRTASPKRPLRTRWS